MQTSKILAGYSRKLNSFFKNSQQFSKALAEYFAKEGVGLKDSTLEKHKFFFNNIVAFLQEKNLHDIMIHELRPRHMEAFRLWLYETRPSCSKEHASRHIKHCIGAIKLAVKLEAYIYVCGIKWRPVVNGIELVESEKDKSAEPVSLTSEEVRRIINYKPISKSHALAIDLFLFQCFTGLSYMDLWLYEVVDEGGHLWVTSANGRGKNGNAYWSEYNDHAKVIHEKYNGEFPEITVQAYNRAIKAIALKLAINKELSSHNARKTFATLKYIQGHSIESIADQLGNDPKTTQKYYITRSNDRTKGEIKRLGDVPLLKAS